MRSFARRLTPIFLALVLAFSASGATRAHGPFEFTNGYYFNSTIGDGWLNICYAGGTPVYNNRAALTNAVRSWGFAINLQINSLGACGPYPYKPDANIVVLWTSDRDCFYGQAYTPQQPWGYSQIKITFNSRCGEGSFYWGEALPVPDGFYDAVTVMRHEAGHALGLGHENESETPGHDPHNFSRDLMDMGAGGCFVGNRSEHSFTDVAGMQARYPGLDPGPNQGPQPAKCWQ